MQDRPSEGGFTREAKGSGSKSSARTRGASPVNMHAVNQRLFDTSLDLLLVVDRKGEFLRVSPSSAAIIGYEPEEMLGRIGHEFIFDEDLDKTRDEMQRARRGLAMTNFDCRYVHKEGRPVPLNWTGVWLPDEQLHFFIGRDMTERLELEAQLRHSQKMESIGRLTGGVAHDFNNLLTVISGMSEIIAETTSEPRIRDMAYKIRDTADRGAQLTQRMLAFARKQALQARSLNLNEIVNHTTVALHRVLREDITIRCVLADSLWTAVADPAQVEDALLNLSINARDAMPRGGELIIETANVHLDEHYAARHAEVEAGDYVCLSVTDSGKGMPPDVIERAFEPFFTTKDVGQGTGLGLSMIYGFMKQSRGHVKIYSEVGVGTSVKLYFPHGTAADTDAGASENTAADLPSSGTILVVEDSIAVRNVACQMLQSLGFETLEAEDAKAALAILQSGRTIDLMFTDMILPRGMSGADLLREARKEMPGLRAVFTSGYSEHFIKARESAEADVPLLGKPYHKRQLQEVIGRALLQPSAARG